MVGAARTIAVGDASIMVAGGVESMTRAPYVLPKSERPFPAGNATVYSTTLGWRMINPDMPEEWTVSLGESTELLGEKYGVSREAAGRVRGPVAATGPRGLGRGAYDAAVVQVPGARAGRATRASATASRSSRWPSSSRPSAPDGTVTAGNASPALRRRRGPAARRRGRRRRARRRAARPDHRHRRRRRRPAVLRDRPGRGGEPGAGQGRPHARRRHHHGAQRGLRRPVARLPVEWHDLDHEIVNPHGGAIAIGHPLGCSGARLAGAVAHQLAAAGVGVGVAALCIGVGQGMALTIDR